MDKINFQDLPNTTTPVRASNLNQLQTNVENAMVEQEYLGNNPDINSLKSKSGIYGLYDCSQAPSSIGSGILEVLVYSPDWVLQRFTDISYNIWKSWERTYYGGDTWSDWKRVEGVEVELYNDSTGSNTSITLSETAANFKYIEIFYRSNDNYYNSEKVYLPNQKNVSLISQWTGPTSLYLKTSVCEINGTAINFLNGYEVSIDTTGTAIATRSGIYITRVIGYK